MDGWCELARLAVGASTEKQKDARQYLADKAETCVGSTTKTKSCAKTVGTKLFVCSDQTLRSMGRHWVAERVRFFPEESSRVHHRATDADRGLWKEVLGPRQIVLELSSTLRANTDTRITPEHERATSVFFRVDT